MRLVNHYRTFHVSDEVVWFKMFPLFPLVDDDVAAVTLILSEKRCFQHSIAIRLQICPVFCAT